MTHKELVAELLRGQTTLSLATAAEDASPQVAPLFYFASDDLDLYWLSSAASVHSRNAMRNPEAAITIYAPAQGWREIRGVQMSGVVSVVSGRAARAPIIAGYCERFDLGALFRVRIARSRLYRFRPRWIRYLDNTRRFGYKFELELEVACES